MLVDNTEIREYPFEGIFYTFGVDESKPLNEQVEEKIIVLSTKCDIQESNKSDSSGNITASFNIYLPFDLKSGISIKRGMTFSGSMYGLEVNGEVIGVFPTQLAGCVCYIKDKDV